jgi:tmRNA-binding protein
MKFRYYITDTIDGMVVGTDSKEVADNYALSEEYYVVDSEEGTWLLDGGEVKSIEQETGED